MEFQFGTNWAEFSRSAGGVIGQTLAMEGSIFHFFSRVHLLGIVSVWREEAWTDRTLVGRILSLAWLLALGLPDCRDELPWMQHRTGYALGPKGEILLSGFWKLLPE